MAEGAVVTSGTYERYLESRQGRLSHILDPRTGRPVKGTVSATVLADEAALADALATALMVKGTGEGIRLLRRLGSVKGVLVEEDGALWVDSRLKGVLKLEPMPGRSGLRFYGRDVQRIPGGEAP